MNHMWAHGSRIDRYLYRTRGSPGRGPGPLLRASRPAFLREAPSTQDADGAPRARGAGLTT